MGAHACAEDGDKGGAQADVPHKEEGGKGGKGGKEKLAAAHSGKERAEDLKKGKGKGDKAEVPVLPPGMCVCQCVPEFDGCQCVL